MNWRFGSGVEGWDTTDFSHDSNERCLTAVVGDGVTIGSVFAITSISGLSIPITTGDPVSIKVKFVGYGDPGTPLVAQFNFNIITGPTDTVFDTSPFTFSSPTDNSGWLQLNGDSGVTGTITQVQFITGVITGTNRFTMLLDSVFVGESPFALTHSGGGIPGAIII